MLSYTKLSPLGRASLPLSLFQRGVDPFMHEMAFIRALLQQANAEGSRSTALKPLGWLVGMLCASSIALFSFSNPTPYGPV